MHPEVVRPSTREPDEGTDSIGPPEGWAGGPYVPGYAPAPAGGGLRYAGVVIGILLLLGLIAMHIAILIPPPGSCSYCSVETEGYLLLVRILMGLSFLAIDVTVVIAVMASWHASVSRPDLTEATRRGVLTFSAVFLGAWIVASIFTSTVLVSLLFR